MLKAPPFPFPKLRGMTIEQVTNEMRQPDHKQLNYFVTKIDKTVIPIPSELLRQPLLLLAIDASQIVTTVRYWTP